MTTTKTLTLTRDLSFPQSRVWRAISTGALLAEWLLPNDFQPLPGHAFTFRTQAQPHWDGRIASVVREVTPESRIRFSWDAVDVVTEVTLMLEPIPTGVRLTMEQSGFRTDQGQAYGGARYGWGMFLDRLDPLLSKED